MHERIEKESNDDGHKYDGKTQRPGDMEKLKESVEGNQQIDNGPYQ